MAHLTNHRRRFTAGNDFGYYCESEQAFSASYRREFSPDEVEYVEFRNDATQVVRLTDFTLASAGSMFIDFVEATFDEGTNDLVIQNYVNGGPSSGTNVVRGASNVTNEQVLTYGMLPAASGPTSAGSIQRFDAYIIFPKGSDNALFKITNNSGQARTVTLTVNWTESDT